VARFGIRIQRTFRKVERIKKTTSKVTKAGLMESQETIEPMIGEAPQKGMCQVGMMPRCIEVASLSVILGKEDLMGDRQGRDGSLFYVAPKSGENLYVEIPSLQVHRDTQEAKLAPSAELW
jgi:hypothetical protein